MHGKFVERVEDSHISKARTYSWLKSAGLKGETEGLIIAAQDQSLPTRNYQANITKTIENDLCRTCKEQKETIDHIVAGCSRLAPTEYLERHNKVAKYIHWCICKDVGAPVCQKWYEHQPEPVTEIKEWKILYDFSIHTDRNIKANRPDLIIKDSIRNKCTLLDVSIPADKNVSYKEFEKKSKYKDLEIEIRRMWKVNTTIVPIVVGALGLISNDFDQYTNEVPGTISKSEVQKITLMGTAHILRKVLMM